MSKDGPNVKSLLGIGGNEKLAAYLSALIGVTAGSECWLENFRFTIGRLSIRAVRVF